MNRRASAFRLSSVAGRLAALLAAGVLGFGCAHQQTRLQSEDEGDKYEVKTIGDVTTVANADPVAVSGVGLVVGLEGTGSDPTPDSYRPMLEEYLRKRGVEHVKELLASKNVSLVLVSALIPAGARKGDSFDVEVTLPPQSRTTSLRGGFLKECVLFNGESTKNLEPGYNGPNRFLKGFELGKAQGPLLTGFGDGDESAKLLRGRIWGGGHCLKDLPFFLVLNSDQQYARLASAVADRVNETFQGQFQAAPNLALAVAKTKAVVVLNVPEQYRHNLPRYLRVVRLIPLREADKARDKDATLAKGGAEPVRPERRLSYRRRLEEELLDPARSVTAALRLEALGGDSIAALKHGLESEHVLVRFTSAEALAYLDSSSGGEELSRLVEQQPALRAFSLTALASLNEAISHVELTRLLASPSAETRYGAFRALRALDEHDEAVRGECLNDSFWLHRAAPGSPPLVHLSSSRRPEVVLFGKDARLVPPFSFLAGEFTVTAGADDNQCTIFCADHGTKRRQCSLKLEEVLRTVAELGALYPEVVDLLKQADQCKCLSCAVAVDALPQATSVYELAKEGVRDGKNAVADEEIRKARGDFTSTPTLFERTAKRPRSAVEKDEEAMLRDKKPKDEKKTTERHVKTEE